MWERARAMEAQAHTAITRVINIMLLCLSPECDSAYQKWYSFRFVSPCWGKEGHFSLSVFPCRKTRDIFLLSKDVTKVYLPQCLVYTSASTGHRQTPVRAPPPGGRRAPLRMQQGRRGIPWAAYPHRCQADAEEEGSKWPGEICPSEKDKYWVNSLTCGI